MNQNQDIRLSQAVALTVARSGAATKDSTVYYHILQKADSFAGHTKKFKPTKLDSNNQPIDPQPDQQKVVQCKVATLLSDLVSVLSGHFDAAATRDIGNTLAKANVVINGTTVMKDVPVPYLLFLESELTNLHTQAQNIPTLSLDKSWTFDQQSGFWKSETVVTNREKKEPQIIKVFEPTEHQEGKFAAVEQSVVTGQWEHVDLSGAIPQTEKQAIIDRIRTVREAVVSAREEANATKIPVQSFASNILNYCLTGSELSTGTTVHAQA